MNDRLRASDVKQLSVVFLLSVLLLTAGSYLVIGCQNDWLVIAGLFVDGIGAGLLAAPDLGSFRSYTYSGSVREAIDDMSGRRDMWIPDDSDWYDVFLEEMKDVLGTEEIPDTAEFRIERSKNSNLLWYMPNPEEEDDTAINLFNVFTPFRDTIEEEEKQIRRYGAGIFIAGIFFQILGILFDKVLFPSVFC